MSGAGSRRKGHDFERVLVQRFAQVFGAEQVRRGFQYRAGTDAPDVETPVFWLEAKRGQRILLRIAAGTGQARQRQVPLAAVGTTYPQHGAGIAKTLGEYCHAELVPGTDGFFPAVGLQ